MKHHGIMKIEQEIELQYGIWLYKILNRDKFALPRYLIDQLNISEAKYNLRGNSQRINSTARHEFADAMFSRKLRDLQNQVPMTDKPDCVWRSGTLAAFKRHFVRL